MIEEQCCHIGKYISQIQRKGASFISKELAPYGIGYGQFLFLIELYKQDGIKQEDLADKLQIDKGTTARAVKKLEEEGFLTRIIDEEDKRAYKIYLTSKGTNIQQTIYKVADDCNTFLTSNITPEEKQLVTTILKKICTIGNQFSTIKD